MFFTLASFLLAPLFVFGVYHLLTWVNAFKINECSYWKQVAVASAISHIVLLSGLAIFLYFDFQAHQRLEGQGWAFGYFLFNRSSFWRLVIIYDTAPALAVIVFSAILDRFGMNPPGLVPLTFAIVYAIGTLQWFFVGGAIGALLERFWSGLKTDDEGEDFREF